jgi:radical SAM superfamily enzyme YgiQ (UPF0313 family)
MWRVKAFMPPQGLLAIAAYLPPTWPVRFVDENLRPATPADFAWADAVFVSGMHIQAPQIRDIARRAKEAGKPVALGGPSVSAAPDIYPDIDYLHIGELGDATDALTARLDEDCVPPRTQIRFATRDRLPLPHFPVPAYHLIPLGRYLIGSLQFSSGCPYRCDFCDIPALYGRQPRLKSPEQLLAELDMMLERPHPQAVYFVDDNFIGNRKATREMLQHLLVWQEQRGFPLQFACEATLNIAKQTDILELMRRAGFVTVFVGIETPELGALKGIRKEHNASVPMFEAIEILNSYGLEITSGIILGLDSDTTETEENLKAFIDRSKIPVLTMNLLQALPKTALWDRLARAGRLLDDPGPESNVRFLRPYDDVVRGWQDCIAYAYDPTRLFARFKHQVEATYVNRIKPSGTGMLTWHNVMSGLTLAANLAIRVGLAADYRRAFWDAAGHALRHGRIDGALGMGFVARHLIEFSREALNGRQNASFYATRGRSDSEPGRSGGLQLGSQFETRIGPLRM